MALSAALLTVCDIITKYSHDVADGYYCEKIFIYPTKDLMKKLILAILVPFLFVGCCATINDPSGLKTTIAAVEAATKPEVTEHAEAVIGGEINDANLGMFAAQLDASLREHPNAKYILVTINSGGGDVDSGFVYTKLIEGSPLPVVCLVDKEAQSMAFYILQSCDYRLMTKRAMVMTHSPRYSEELPMSLPPDVQLMLNEQLAASTYGMIEQIAGRMGLTHEELAMRIAQSGSGQWIMTWHEAFDNNAVDAVVKNGREAEEWSDSKVKDGSLSK